MLARQYLLSFILNRNTIYVIVVSITSHAWVEGLVLQLWCFVLVHIIVPFPEVVDVTVETLQGVFTKGVCRSTLSWALQLRDYSLTLYAWGATRLPCASKIQYGHTPPQAWRVMI